jgi:hypothetical protein
MNMVSPFLADSLNQRRLAETPIILFGGPLTQIVGKFLRPTVSTQIMMEVPL